MGIVPYNKIFDLPPAERSVCHVQIARTINSFDAVLQHGLFIEVYDGSFLDLREETERSINEILQKERTYWEQIYNSTDWEL